MTNQIISSKILDFHAAEIKPTILRFMRRNKKSVAFDTRSKRNGTKKVSKGLNTGAVRQIMLADAKHAGRHLDEKKSPKSFFLAFQS